MARSGDRGAGLTDAEDLTPIDRFISARLRSEGFDLAEHALPRDLIRRLHLDLTGLPPSFEDVRRFEMDPSDEARAEVDQPGSIAHAEHWARFWLEAARYADSHGYTIDGSRSIWPWRDWVIRSIHADQRFSDFTVEQLAGDLLPGATREQRIATGFHRNTQINQGGGAKDENRINAVIDPSGHHGDDLAPAPPSDALGAHTQVRPDHADRGYGLLPA